MAKKILQFPVMYREDPEGGYIAIVPQLPGCHTQGATLEQAEKRIVEVIEVYLESVKARRQKSYQPSKIFFGSVAVAPSL